MGRRRAPVPTPAVLRAIQEQRKANREAVKAVPGTTPVRMRPVGAPPGHRPSKEERPCKKLYRVCGPRVVEGKKKGDTVELCDNGATNALVQAGHLVLVVEQKIEVETEQVEIEVEQKVEIKDQRP